jgi:hypothetical protein
MKMYKENIKVKIIFNLKHLFYRSETYFNAKKIFCEKKIEKISTLIFLVLKE